MKQNRLIEIVSHCPLCGHSEFSLFLKGSDYFLTQEEFTISACKRCGFRFTNPRPVEAAARKYYQSEAYLSHESENNGFIAKIYRLARWFTIRQKFRIITRFSTGNTLLDIGCGSGELLGFCQRKGICCTGVEPAQKARRIAMEKHHLQVVEHLFEIPQQSPGFHCITLWHSLEHIYHLPETMENIHRLLAPDGTVVLALPNSDSPDAIHYGKYWAAYDLPRHVYHFTKKTAEKLAQKHAFSCIQIIPQKLDAYYISILSEHYKSGSHVRWPPMVQGFLSNLRAGQGKAGHSSLIYILKPKIS